jgi:hypothetical protein
MTHPLRGGLTFVPALEEFARERAGAPVTVLCGGNNSGKSLMLKWLKNTMGKTAYMVGSRSRTDSILAAANIMRWTRSRR